MAFQLVHTVGGMREVYAQYTEIHREKSNVHQKGERV